MAEQNTFQVKQLPIKLGQLLKLSELVQDGFEAKVRIQYGEVMVNGEVVTERGKKIVAGDSITYNDQTLLITD